MSLLKLLTVGALLILSGCTSSPLYDSPRGVNQPVLDYAEPTTRIEQIIYDELRLRLPSASDAGVPRLSLTTTMAATTEALSQRSGSDRLELVTITATATLQWPDSRSRVITRAASANYTANMQGLSAQEARLDAENRAARSVAEQLRLALLAELAGR